MVEYFHEERVGENGQGEEYRSYDGDSLLVKGEDERHQSEGGNETSNIEKYHVYQPGNHSLYDGGRCLMDAYVLSSDNACLCHDSVSSGVKSL